MRSDKGRVTSSSTDANGLGLVRLSSCRWGPWRWTQPQSIVKVFNLFSFPMTLRLSKQESLPVESIFIQSSWSKGISEMKYNRAHAHAVTACIGPWRYGRIFFSFTNFNKICEIDGLYNIKVFTQMSGYSKMKWFKLYYFKLSSQRKKRFMKIIKIVHVVPFLCPLCSAVTSRADHMHLLHGL
jgi:hypothetical protein